MLPLLGSRKILCDGLTRRDLLHVGGLGLFGLGLSDLFRLQAAPPFSEPKAARFGQAKACILIHLFGAAPQHETFDPKPDAPREVQGDLKAIRTSLLGVLIGEGLPKVARIMDRLTVVRSLHHAFPFHSVVYALSGTPAISATVEAVPNDRTVFPAIGSVVDYWEDRGGKLPPLSPFRGEGPGVRGSPMPRNMALPFPLYSRANFPLLGGPYAGFLGSKYDPVWTDFTAKGTKAVPNLKGKSDVFDPFGGIRPEDRFEMAGAAALSAGLTPQRLDQRRSLVSQFDKARSWLDRHEKVQGFRRHEERAYSVLTSPKLARALDIQSEPLVTRERYGMTLFGQSLLAARRLVEAGSRFVTVFWDAYDDAAAGWDTHYYHYDRLTKFLLPGFDQSFPALILDLENRGMLDETLVVCVSEHGRTPRINQQKGGGRDHWSRVYSSVLAGGGSARGKVVGKSDSHGAEVADIPVSPKDILATSFHLLGIDPHTTIHDQLNRPVPIAGEGVFRPEFLG